MANRKRIFNFAAKTGKMRKYILSWVLLTVVLTVTAAERPASKMRQVALKTLNSGRTRSVLNKPTLEVYSDGTCFSVISRDDRFPEVLAYGYGNFDIEQAPANVRWWFDRVQRSMEKAIKKDAPRYAGRTYVPIAPMMETKWGQGIPYNNYAPIFGNEKAPAGCIATAMAQLMNYQQYPASASFNGSYIVGNITYREIVNSNYSWPYQLAYGYYLPTADAEEVTRLLYTPRQGNSVAALLRDCGYAVNMKYDASGSGAMTFDVGEAFVEKFGYPRESVKYLMRDYFAEREWMDMVYAELANNCPILYAGSSAMSGGHAFVLHGMDAEGLVFVNWGWQGQFDGYYAIDILNPEGEDFSDGEEMIIGVRPTTLPTDGIQSCFVTEAPYEFSYNNVTKELTVSFTEFVFNASCYAFTGRWCLVVEDMANPDNVEFIDMLEDGFVLEPFWGFAAWSNSDTFTPEPGFYRLYFATLDTGETDWQYVRTGGGAFYYDMTVAADGTVTIADAPIFAASGFAVTPVRDVHWQPKAISSDTRYYNLQGREVGSDTHGLVIMKQGNTVKKMFR